TNRLMRTAPDRADAFQSMSRTSSPGTYGRRSSNSILRGRSNAYRPRSRRPRVSVPKCAFALLRCLPTVFPAGRCAASGHPDRLQDRVDAHRGVDAGAGPLETENQPVLQYAMGQPGNVFGDDVTSA